MQQAGMEEQDSDEEEEEESSDEDDEEQGGECQHAGFQANRRFVCRFVCIHPFLLVFQILRRKWPSWMRLPGSTMYQSRS